MSFDQIDDALAGQDITGTDVVAALVVLLLGTGLAVLTGRFITKRLGRPDQQAQQIVKQAARAGRWLIQIAAIAWALAILGFDLQWLTLVIAAVLVVGVLAAKPLVESMAVSAVVTSRPTFGIGQEIEVGEDRIRGEVLEVTTRSLVLGLKDGSHLHLPHADLLETPVRVFTTGKPRRSTLEVSIPFSVDVAEAERAILDALEAAGAVRSDPPPAVLVGGYDAGVRLSVRFWHGDTISEGTRATDQAGRAIRRALSDTGIGTAVPALDVAAGIHTSGVDPGAATSG